MSVIIVSAHVLLHTNIFLMDEKKELGFRNNISKICELLEDVYTKVDNTCSEQEQINKRIDDISSVVMDLEAQCNQNFTRTGQMATICMELNSGMPSDSNNTSSKEVIKSCGEICHNCTNCSKLRKDLSSMQLSLFSMEQKLYWYEDRHCKESKKMSELEQSFQYEMNHINSKIQQLNWQNEYVDNNKMNVNNNNE